MTDNFSPVEVELKNLLDSVFGADERKIEVLNRYSGFALTRLENLSEIAADMDVTNEGVRQIDARAVTTLLTETKDRHPEEFLTSYLIGLQKLEAVAPCSCEDASRMLYSQGVSDRRDIDIEAYLKVASIFEMVVDVMVVYENKVPFLVSKAEPIAVAALVSLASREVSHYGAYHVNRLMATLSETHTHPFNQARFIVTALKSRDDFIWLEKEDFNELGGETGWYFLAKAGRNPIVS